ncbi:MAG TPA: hypothetical protein VEY89_10210 [Candidatus Dormibacteraeota bacterium]|nr:hypothetical protein [Candidatus Dormibacteraeota bacterium]
MAGKPLGALAGASAAKVLRVVVGLLGAALIGWVATPLLQSLPAGPGPAAPATAAPATTAAAPSTPGEATPPAPTDTPAQAAAPGPTPTELVQSASTALNGCPTPTAPQLPEGDRATLAQMNQARQAFQAYDAATNAYARCVDDAVDRVAQQRGGSASAASLTNLKAFGVRAHNAAIDEEQSVAEQLNAQVRAYNAKHPRK